MNRKKQKAKLSGILTGLPATPAEKPADPQTARTDNRPPSENRGPGRPPGKRTNPAYQSVTTFLHKQTYREVQRALIGTGQDFGDIVDELLTEWLKRNAETAK